jgi:hypothetical protein
MFSVLATLHARGEEGVNYSIVVALSTRAQRRLWPLQAAGQRTADPHSGQSEIFSCLILLTL